MIDIDVDQGCNQRMGLEATQSDLRRLSSEEVKQS